MYTWQHTDDIKHSLHIKIESYNTKWQQTHYIVYIITHTHNHTHNTKTIPQYDQSLPPHTSSPQLAAHTAVSLCTDHKKLDLYTHTCMCVCLCEYVCVCVCVYVGYVYVWVCSFFKLCVLKWICFSYDNKKEEWYDNDDNYTKIRRYNNDNYYTACKKKKQNMMIMTLY